MESRAGRTILSKVAHPTYANMMNQETTAQHRRVVRSVFTQILCQETPSFLRVWNDGRINEKGLMTNENLYF